MKKNVYRFLSSFVLIVAGVFCVLVTTGLFYGKLNNSFYTYFTYICAYASFIYMLVEFFYNLIVSIKNKSLNYITIDPEMKFSLMIGELLVFVVANTFLAKDLGWLWESKYWANLVNPFVHFAFPILLIFDYFYFSDHHYRWYTPFKTLVLPGAYALVVVICGFIVGFNKVSNDLPYDFINPDVVGYPSMIFTIIGLICGLLLFSYFVSFMDKYLQNKKFRKKVDKEIIDVVGDEKNDEE
jgi:hypothetical protein